MSYGRLKIYSDAKKITAQNVVDEVNKAYALHVQNRADIKRCGNIIGENKTPNIKNVHIRCVYKVIKYDTIKYFFTKQCLLMHIYIAIDLKKRKSTNKNAFKR